MRKRKEIVKDLKSMRFKCKEDLEMYLHVELNSEEYLVLANDAKTCYTSITPQDMAEVLWDIWDEESVPEPTTYVFDRTIEDVKDVHYFISDEDVIEHKVYVDAFDDGVLYSLVRSNADIWCDSVKGETILRVYDDGDRLLLNKSIDANLEFYEMAEIELLFNFIRTL